MKFDLSAPRISLELILTTALLVSVVTVPPSVTPGHRTAVPERVPVLYRGNRDFRANVIFDQNFRAALQSASGAVEYYLGYPESNRLPGENQSLLLRDFLRRKYADRAIDVVVDFSQIALDFLFREPSVWEDYKWYAIALICLITFQSALIAGLVMSRSRRKRAEEERGRALFEVAESRTRLAGLVGSAMDAIISIDENQRIVLFNRAAQKMFGCTEREVIGEGLDRFVPQGFQQSHQEHVRAFGETTVTTRSMGSVRATFGRRIDGEEFPIEASISQLELHGHKFYTVILRDISRRNQALEALRESEERFRNMADTAPVMIWIAGADKLRTYFNQQWLDFTGRTLKAETGNGWAEGVHSDDYQRCIETYTAAFDRREPFRMEYRLRCWDGRFRWIYDAGIARFSTGGEFLGYIGSCIDITDRKCGEDALRKSEGELRESYNRIEDLAGRLIAAQEEERNRIARELHDDLNQRVAALAIGLGTLERALPETDGPTRIELRILESRTVELSEWIRRLSHELHSSILEHVGLSEALNLYCSGFSEEQGISVKVTLNGGIVPLPRDIALCLYRVAQEALRNIARHSGAKNAELALVLTESFIELRIVDQGVGFDPNSPSRKEGLGLVSMDERVRLLGGSLDVKSEPGAGTEVRVYVPTRVRA